MGEARVTLTFSAWTRFAFSGRAPRITAELLNVENVSVTAHLTEECKRVIAEKAIGSFDLFFDKIVENKKKKVLSFVERQVGSSRKTLRAKAAEFLKKWG